jgi:hypothetical protein
MIALPHISLGASTRPVTADFSRAVTVAPAVRRNLLRGGSPVG